MRVNRKNKDEEYINMNKIRVFVEKMKDKRKQNDCNENKSMLKSESVSKKEE